MAHQFNQANQCFVVLDDSGYMNLYSQNGDLVGKNIWLRVTDSCDDCSFVIGKFTCNIVGTKEEMFKEIEQYKKDDNSNPI